MSHRWSWPIPLWSVRRGRLVGDPPPDSLEHEARVIRRLNELREDRGRERYPDTEWAYRDPLVPPERRDP